MRGDSDAVAPLIGIVDDDTGVRESIQALLRSAGFRTAVFASAESFLRSDLMNAAKCLILDIRMPQMSGLELQERLAQRAPGIPIIFATAYEDDTVRKKAFHAGAVAFLGKPFADDDLLSAMRRALIR